MPVEKTSTGDVILVEEESPLRRIWTRRTSRSVRAKENLTVLMATAAAFLLFVIAEMVGSYLSNSLALLSDAGAMVVDVITYLCNIYAEVLKANDKEMDRSTRFTLEVLMPGISLVGLLMVTTYVTLQALHILQCPQVGHDDDVDINYLYGFSAANVLIDVFSSMMFFFKPNDSVDDLSAMMGTGPTTTHIPGTYMHRYVYLHSSMCTCIHTFIHVHMHTYIHPCIHAYMHKYIQGTYMHRYIHPCILCRS